MLFGTLQLKSLYHKHDKYFGRQISTNICYDKSYEINKKVGLDMRNKFWILQNVH